MSYMNLLFIRYLQKLIIQATNDGKNSAANNYRKALNSIKKYPLPLRSGLEAKDLVGVGDSIANKLENLLKKYKQNIPEHDSLKNDISLKRMNEVRKDGNEMQKRARISQDLNILKERQINNIVENNRNKNEMEKAKNTPNKLMKETKRKTTKKSKETTPPRRKVTAKRTPNKNIISISKILLDPSIPIPSPTTINQDSEKKKRKRRDEKEEEIISNENNNKIISNKRNKNNNNSKSSMNKENEVNKMKISSIFTPLKNQMPLKDKIVLILDNRENNNKKVNNEKRDLVQRLNSKGIECEIRCLNVGDFMWVVKKENGEEKVLDWIVERKSICDLSHSIIDKRYKEQKFRIKQCGISNIFYIIEGNISAWDKNGRGICSNSLESSLFSTSHGTHNFIVNQTKNMEETLHMLAKITMHITRLYRKSLEDPFIKAITSFSFNEFNLINDKSKNLTIKDIFGKQLMQIKGLSGDKANLVCQHYPTPQFLNDAYLSLDSKKEKENLFTELKSNGRRNFAMSKNLFNFYSN